jgi:hypothetical protein
LSGAFAAPGFRSRPDPEKSQAKGVFMSEPASAAKSVHTGRKLAALMLAGACVLALGGCQTKAEKAACPVANVLANTAELFVFKHGMEGDPAGELYHVEITGVNLSCDFDREEGTTNSDIDVQFKATRAPTGDEAHYTVPYFVASVLNGADVQDKKILATPFDFAPGEATVTFTANVSSFLTKFANGKKPYEYGILAGIQLTREQLDYSNKRRRLTP